jgi:acetylornithine deacetylase/succinyl-diaminopimelate desuccinylase-like protein
LSKKVPLGVDAILIGEPSGVSVPWEAIFTVSRGISCFEISITGKQGHSGLSAILSSSATIGLAKAIIAISQMRITYPHSFDASKRPTINAGVTVNGGVMYGVHPGEARFGCDVRLVPGMTQEDLEKDIGFALNSALPKDLSWSIKWESGFGWMDAVQIADNHPLVKATQNAAISVLGQDIPLGTYPGGTDASHFCKIAGIPTLASFGPGWLSVAHGPNECVGLSQVREAKKMYRLIAEKYLVNSH